MIVVRNVFQAKYGRGDELVALIKEAKERWSEAGFDRVLTDLSGPFFTVVTEHEVENLAAWEASIQEAMNHAEFGEWFGRMTELVESGRREFYNLVE